MNNDIKFKLVNTETNEIVEYINFSITLDGQVQSFDKNGEIEGTNKNKHFKPIRYAGIADKYKEDIYEGYIVKSISMVPGGKDFIGVVKFNECCFWIDNGLEAIPLFSEIDEREIVGTIYENF